MGIYRLKLFEGTLGELVVGLYRAALYGRVVSIVLERTSFGGWGTFELSESELLAPGARSPSLGELGRRTFLFPFACGSAQFGGVHAIPIPGRGAFCDYLSAEY